MCSIPSHPQSDPILPVEVIKQILGIENCVIKFSTHTLVEISVLYDTCITFIRHSRFEGGTTFKFDCFVAVKEHLVGLQLRIHSDC